MSETTNRTAVNNPLTIIAIFATLAEVSMTVTVGLLDKDQVSVFIWFIILFPFFLVTMFFFVLWNKPNHFYSPGDFKDDDTYVKVNAPLLSSEIAEPTEKSPQESKTHTETKETKSETEKKPIFTSTTQELASKPQNIVNVSDTILAYATETSNELRNQFKNMPNYEMVRSLTSNFITSDTAEVSVGLSTGETIKAYYTMRKNMLMNKITAVVKGDLYTEEQPTSRAITPQTTAESILQFIGRKISAVKHE